MKKKSGTKSTSLRIVKSYFPNVTKVRDADKPIHIEVTDADNKSSKVRNHNGCAMAVACKRTFNLSGVIVAVKTAYLIKGNEAVRYSLPESVSREIVSFDRDAGFSVGEYHLDAPIKSHRLGAPDDRMLDRHKSRGNGETRFIHRTTGVRAALGSKRAPDGITVGDD